MAPRPVARRFVPLLALLGSTLAAQSPAAHAPATPSPSPTAPPSYDRLVRPILADRCFKCHGHDSGSRRAELRLDLRDDAIAEHEHGIAIVPGDAAKSELWRRITTDDVDDAMPPRDSGKQPLSAAEREVLRAWIDGGAIYEPHWSFVPPQRPPLPATASDPWCRTPVDAFVLEELRRNGLEPSAAAAPERLLRRLFLALTGLPPTPEELAAFLADPSPAAYDRTVDRLLDEEPYRSRFAERMATPWLDGARYADTCGIHMDAGRQMWAYRDWVLQAFRDNMPFDRFVTEQIAGDLLPDATLAQKVASGFNRCHVTTDEGGAIADEYLVEYAVDRVATTGSVFLGLTLGCARCHEHKFDPVSQDDFYRLFAYFNSIEEPGLYSQEKDPQRAFEPSIAVPSAEQTAKQQQLNADLAASKQQLEAPSPDDDAQFATWQQQLMQKSQLQWHASTTAAATAEHGSTVTVEQDGVVTASGENPAREIVTVRLRTTARDLHMLSLQALPDPARDDQRVGRAPNGNAVLMAVEVEAISQRDPSQHQRVPLVWAWADVEQQNGDHAVTNALAADDGVGWAVDAHSQPGGPRTALFLADAPFGFDGGTEVVVTLRYDSIYSQHTLARVRLQLGSIADAGLDALPLARGRLQRCGPFRAEGRDDAWSRTDGPELATHLDRKQRFSGGAETNGAGAAGGEERWRFREEDKESANVTLPSGIGRTYLAQQLFVPSARSLDLGIGSDDGFKLYLDGKEVAGKKVDRSLSGNEDRVTVQLERGSHLLTLAVVNTGGNAGYWLGHLPPPPGAGRLDGALAAALLPTAMQSGAPDVRAAWRTAFSPHYVELQRRVQQIEKDIADLERSIPRTMVMQEMAKPRETFVLSRGEYDKPDKSRPVQRGVPAALGPMPEGAPADRRGLAQWLLSPQNPLLLRVQCNRLFELLFGTGIVRTSEDFGMQGEWPSHKELLDWLAIELRENGYDLRHVLRLLCKSATFRQSARVAEAAQAIDADNRLLGWFPRRRLTAEQLRDQALYVSGLLVEKLGGPSVKPPQPPGLWQEVAMTQSNTREFVASTGDDAYRRSLYTYQKRACPPPSMLTFDAPTREFCTIRRSATNTPLQALVLWNDPQFVEAARALAQRANDAGGDDAARLSAMFVRCTQSKPDHDELARMQKALATFRTRFCAEPEAAKALLAVGTAPLRADVDAAELAALTMIANAILALDTTICTP